MICCNHLLVTIVGLEPTRPARDTSFYGGMSTDFIISSKSVATDLLVRIVGLEPTRIFQQTLLRRSGLPIPPYPHVVASVGLEPTHPFGHQILSLACLPISPQGHVACLFQAVNHCTSQKLRFGYAPLL